MLKKSNYILFLLVGMIFISCERSDGQDDKYADSLPAMVITWDSENSIVCLGTSITNGMPFSFMEEIDNEQDSSATYPYLLGEELVLHVHNEGYWGAKAIHFLPELETYVFSKNPALVLLEIGANEFLRQDSVDLAEANIDSLISLIQSKNIPIVLLSFTNPDMVNDTPEDHFLYPRSDLALDYYQMLLRISERYELPFIDYMYKGVWGNSNKMSTDGIHPNDAGNLLLKENVFEAMYNTFQSNGLLR